MGTYPMLLGVVALIACQISVAWASKEDDAKSANEAMERMISRLRVPEDVKKRLKPIDRETTSSSKQRFGFYKFNPTTSFEIETGSKPSESTAGVNGIHYDDATVSGSVHGSARVRTGRNIETFMPNNHLRVHSKRHFEVSYGSSNVEIADKYLSGKTFKLRLPKAESDVEHLQGMRSKMIKEAVSKGKDLEIYEQKTRFRKRKPWNQDMTQYKIRLNGTWRPLRKTYFRMLKEIVRQKNDHGNFGPAAKK